jgi:hypothetical protein
MAVAVLTMVATPLVGVGTASASARAAASSSGPPVVTSISPNVGTVRGGTLVTVIGHNFRGSSGSCAPGEIVNFGADPQYNYAIPATSLSVVSDTQLVATTPPDYGGPVDVQVQNGCGLSAPTSSDVFTYSYAFDGQCLSGSCTFNVNALSPQGLVTHVGDGLLDGFGNPLTTQQQQLMTALSPKWWRMSGGTGANGMFQTARKAGANISNILETDWLNCYGQPSTACPDASQPWANLSSFYWYIRNDVVLRQQQGSTPDYWDVWNEPDSSGTVDQYLSVYKTAYQAITAQDATAKVIGPSIGFMNVHRAPSGNSPGSNLDLNTFADFAQSNNLQFAAITYHDNGIFPPPGTVGIQRNSFTPEQIAANVATAKQVLAQHPLLVGTQVFVNEYGLAPAIHVPGWIVGSMAALESSAPGQANIECPLAQDCWQLGDGLLGYSGAPQMGYWVVKDYSQLSGTRVATSSTGSNISAVATRDDTNQTVQVLLGRHDECGSPPRLHFGAPLPSYTCPQFQSPRDPAVQVTAKVTVPYPVTKAKVTINRLPDSGLNSDGNNDVPSAPAPTVLTLPVSNGVVIIGPGWFGDGDAVDLTVAPG